MARPEPQLTSLAWDDLDAVFDAVLDISGSEKIAAATYEGILAAVERASSTLATPSVEGSGSASLATIVGPSTRAGSPSSI